MNTDTLPTMRVRCPMIVAALKIEMNLTAGKLAALVVSRVLARTKEEEQKVDEVGLKYAEHALALTDRMERELQFPPLALRFFNTKVKPESQTATLRVLFPAKVGNADLRAIFESWSFPWTGDAGPAPYGCPRLPGHNDGWSQDAAQIYRNDRHALVSITYRRIS